MAGSAYQSGIIVSQLVHSVLFPLEFFGECLRKENHAKQRIDISEKKESGTAKFEDYSRLPLHVGHVELVLAVLQSFTSPPSKADTSLRRTVGAGLERVRLRGS